MLIIFTFTYLIRWIGDAFLVPMFLKINDLNNCTLEGTPTSCSSFIFVFYYMLSSLIYDFLPISLIVFFHFLAFRMKELPEVDVEEGETIGDERVNGTSEEKELGFDGMHRDFDGNRNARESI